MAKPDPSHPEIPALGVGTWELRGRRCADIVREALELGYRHLDTAQMYENEAEVGKAIAGSSVDREEVFVTTKLWYDSLEPQQVPKAVDASLGKLETGYIDLLLIHWPNKDVPLESTLEAMLDAREQGKTRSIGVSNFTPSLWSEALQKAPVHCNQVEYHPFLDQQSLLEMAREGGLQLVAYCPLAQGDVVEDQTLKVLGERHGKSPAQIALRWLVQQQPVAAIPKTSRTEHLQENYDIFDFELTQEEMMRISDLRGSRRKVDPSWAPWKWD